MTEPRLQESSSERRLWTVDLNDVRVIDQHGNALEVASTVGSLNGPLTVHLAERAPADD